MRNKSTLFWNLAVIFTLVAIPLFAETPSTTNQHPSSDAITTYQKLSDDISGVSKSVESLEKRIEKVEKDKNKKDIWDKISSVSGLISGLLVALIGGIATYIYRERQMASEEAKSKRETIVSQIQTVQSFLPHLQSTDKLEKEAALLAIAGLGNSILATQLADLYRDEAGIGALSKISVGSDEQGAKVAQKALNRIFSGLQDSVVMIEKDGKFTNSGVIISSDGLIATADYLAREDKEPINVKISNDNIFEAITIYTDSKRGVSVIKIDGTDFPFINLSRQDRFSTLGEEIIAIGYDRKLGWTGISGHIDTVAIMLKLGSKTYDGLFSAKLEVQPGFGGGPVLNTNGEIIGLIHSRSSNRTYFASARAIAEALDSIVRNRNNAEQKDSS